jgi:hypothetical protein
MHFDDHHRALSEIRRVLKQGCSFSLTVWAEAADNQFISIPISLASGLATEKVIHQTDPFSFGSPDAVRRALEKGGFEQISVCRVRGQFDFNMVLKQIVLALDAYQRATLSESLERAYAVFETPLGFSAPCSLLVAGASKK